jgi:hypothetical protein
MAKTLFPLLMYQDHRGQLNMDAIIEGQTSKSSLSPSTSHRLFGHFSCQGRLWVAGWGIRCCWEGRTGGPSSQRCCVLNNKGTFVFVVPPPILIELNHP